MQIAFALFLLPLIARNVIIIRAHKHFQSRVVMAPSGCALYRIIIVSFRVVCCDLLCKK